MAPLDHSNPLATRGKLRLHCNISSAVQPITLADGYAGNIAKAQEPIMSNLMLHSRDISLLPPALQEEIYFGGGSGTKEIKVDVAMVLLDILNSFF